VIGDAVLGPDQMRDMVGSACGGRPSVIVMSACYSGQFVAPLQGDNRIVMTAARPDRTSSRLAAKVAEEHPAGTAIVVGLPNDTERGFVAAVEEGLQKRGVKVRMIPSYRGDIRINAS